MVRKAILWGVIGLIICMACNLPVLMALAATVAVSVIGALN